MSHVAALQELVQALCTTMAELHPEFAINAIILDLLADNLPECVGVGLRVLLGLVRHPNAWHGGGAGLPCASECELCDAEAGRPPRLKCGLGLRALLGSVSAP